MAVVHGFTPLLSGLIAIAWFNAYHNSAATELIRRKEIFSILLVPADGLRADKNSIAYMD
jgi:hypothetical protein